MEFFQSRRGFTPVTVSGDAKQEAAASPAECLEQKDARISSLITPAIRRKDKKARSVSVGPNFPVVVSVILLMFSDTSLRASASSDPFSSMLAMLSDLEHAAAETSEKQKFRRVRPFPTVLQFQLSSAHLPSAAARAGGDTSLTNTNTATHSDPAKELPQNEDTGRASLTHPRPSSTYDNWNLLDCQEEQQHHDSTRKFPTDTRIDGRSQPADARLKTPAGSSKHDYTFRSQNSSEGMRGRDIPRSSHFSSEDSCRKHRRNVYTQTASSYLNAKDASSSCDKRKSTPNKRAPSSPRRIPILYKEENGKNKTNSLSKQGIPPQQQLPSAEKSEFSHAAWQRQATQRQAKHQGEQSKDDGQVQLKREARRKNYLQTRQKKNYDPLPSIPPCFAIPCEQTHPALVTRSSESSGSDPYLKADYSSTVNPPLVAEARKPTYARKSAHGSHESPSGCISFRSLADSRIRCIRRSSQRSQYSARSDSKRAEKNGPGGHWKGHERLSDSDSDTSNAAPCRRDLISHHSSGSSYNSFDEPSVSAWGARPQPHLFSVAAFRRKFKYHGLKEKERHQVNKLVQQVLRAEQWVAQLPETFAGPEEEAESSEHTKRT